MEVVESSSAHIMQNVSRGVSSCPSLKDIPKLLADEEAAVLKTRSCSLPGDYYFDQQESTKFSTDYLSEVSTFDGQERLVEACYYDSEGGQETEDFNPNLLESPPVEAITEDCILDSLRLSSADDSWYMLVPYKDGYSRMTKITEAKLDDDDDDDSSVDKELINEYLEGLDANEKKVKEYVDSSLLEVKSYHSLTRLKKLDWLTLKLIYDNYDPYCTNWTPPTLLPPVCVPDEAESDYEEDSDQDNSDHEDCILDLNSLFLEDSDVALT